MNIRLLKIKTSLVAAGGVFNSFRYMVGAAIGAFAITGVIIWSLNFDVLAFIVLDAPLSALEKIDFLLSGYSGLTQTFESTQAVAIVIFSILFGINSALIAYVFKHRGLKGVPKKSGGGAFLLALLGGGCIACGSSLIAPLLITLGVTSVPLVRELSTLFSAFGSVMLLYSIYKLGGLVATIQSSLK